MPNPNCIVPECGKPARSSGSTLCPMHYHRQYRHGNVHMVASPEISVSHGRRYKTRHMKGHPLASKHNIVYVHRQVLFDTIGPGEQQCHWCAKPIAWFLDKTDPDSIHVDHLNSIGDDNRPENLVASCRACNSTRGLQRRADALRDAGFWSGNDTIAHLRNPEKKRKPKVEPSGKG